MERKQKWGNGKREGVRWGGVYLEGVVMGVNLEILSNEIVITAW